MSTKYRLVDSMDNYKTFRNFRIQRKTWTGWKTVERFTVDCQTFDKEGARIATEEAKRIFGSYFGDEFVIAEKSV